MTPIENSPQLWNKLWARSFSGLPLSRPIDSLIRRVIYFSAFDDLMSGFSFANQDMLELGSGTGNHSLYLARRHHAKSATLIDFSEAVLAKVNSSRFPCPVSKLNQDLLTFSPDVQYDFVHSTGLIEHFMGTERLRVVKIHADCTKKGGLVMIWVPVYSLPFVFIGQINRWAGIQEIPFTKDELRKIVAQCGLKIIHENQSVGGAIFGILARKI